MTKAKRTNTNTYAFVFVKPKGLKKYPRMPKRTASLVAWERWKNACDMVDQHNAPILKRYRQLDDEIKARRGMK